MTTMQLNAEIKRIKYIGKELNKVLKQLPEQARYPHYNVTYVLLQMAYGDKWYQLEDHDIENIFTRIALKDIELPINYI